MHLSIIIPLFNESESLKILADEIHSVLNDLNYVYEIIFIDDGSTDNSWDIVNSLTSETNIKAIRLKKNINYSLYLRLILLSF